MQNQIVNLPTNNVIVVYKFLPGIDENKFSIQSPDFDYNLTSREKEVLKLIVDGRSNSEIADELSISVHTAKAHVCNIMQKLNVSDRVRAAVLAVKENLVRGDL